MNKTYEEFLTGMKEAYVREAGVEADDAGDAGIRLKLLAEELFSLQSYADFLERQVFPQTAQGIYLDYHAKMRGMERKQATAAQGKLEFFSSSPAEKNIVIPAGTLCTSPGNLQGQYVTLAAAVLLEGALSVSVAAESVTAGEQGNAAAGTVTNLILPISGISRAANPVPFSGGSDPEGDAALRERLLQSYPQVSNGANLQYYLEKALAFEEVVSANVLPRARGVGTLDVAVRTHTGEANAALLQKIQTAVEQNREFCMDVKARSGMEKTVPVSLLVQAGEAYEASTLSEAVKAAILTYVDGLPLGTPLLVSQLGRRILEVEGVKNYRMTTPYNDVAPQADQWLRAVPTVFVYR